MSAGTPHPNLTLDFEEVGNFRYAVVRVPVSPETESLTAWWLMTSARDLWAQTPKMHEYGGKGGGSSDLTVMGDALGEFSDMHDAPDAIKQEMSIWFYVLGKVSRLISDYKQKRQGKADTWHDITVYSMIARRIQEHGRWP